MNNSNHTDLVSRFPELKNPEEVLIRVSDAFVAPEYARAGLGLLRRVLRQLGHDARFGLSTVVTAPEHYTNIIATVAKWWFVNFHIADAEHLEHGDDDEDIAPPDFPDILEHQKAEHEEMEEANDEQGEDDGDDDDDELEVVEATFYQVGTFLLDSAIIPHETIFDREDNIDCYAYDYPDERIEAERFYWARLVWEPEDLENEDLVNALMSAANFVLTYYAEDMPFAEFHDSDLAQVILDEGLAERVIGAADFGDVVVIDPNADDE
ncbi:MAG: hypothetical protein JNJ94_01030 [Chlorobi bacterium]|nr:hypothetical protein [Chlorobiota bacterium]